MQKTINRRNFLSAAGMACSGTLLASNNPIATDSTICSSLQKTRIKLGVSTYSYWQIRPRPDIENVIDRAAALGLEGVEILHSQMESEDKAYINQLKKRAFEAGIGLICLAIDQSFVSPDVAVRQRNIDHTLRCIEVAHNLGVPSIRLNSGRWGTIRAFNDLIAANGIEPPIEGYTDDGGFKWCIDSIEKCIPKAQECGVVLALENHWGMTATPEGMLRIKTAINSEWLQLLPDTGNFLHDPYDKLEKVAPHAIYLHAKTYYGGGLYYSLELDFDRIFRIFKDVGYNGYISIEYEGRENPETGVAKSVAMLRESIDKIYS